MKAKSLAVLLLVGSVMANTQKSVIHLNLVEPDAKAEKAEAPADAAPASDPKKEAEEAIRNSEADAAGGKPLRYATNGKIIPGPFGKADNEAVPVEGSEVDTENGKAKPKKKLNKEEKQEEEEEKEHPEKVCESLKKSAKGEEETKQEKVNEPAPTYEKPKDPPRKKKPPKPKAAAAAGAAAAAPAAAKAVAKPATPPAPVAAVKADVKKDAPKNKVLLMISEQPSVFEKMDEETGNAPKLNKVTGKPDAVPMFMNDESFVQKKLNK